MNSKPLSLFDCETENIEVYDTAKILEGKLKIGMV